MSRPGTLSPVADRGEIDPLATQAAMAPASEAPAQMFERLARDPSMDVDKLERLMQMHERATARWAQEQFNAAMSEAQAAMRPVAADADNPQTRSRYASYAALDRAIRPIYTKHGFGLSFNTGESPLPEHVRVICDVSHRGGHEKAYHVDMPSDGKGARGGDVMTKTHATGAALSYGMRYLLKMIFNIAVGEDDRDGNAASGDQRDQPPLPSGFDAWWRNLQAAAEHGWNALMDSWKASSETYRIYAQEHCRVQLDGLKTKARDVSRRGGSQ